MFTHLTAQVKEGRFDEAESALDSGDYNDALTPAQVRGLRSAIQTERNRLAEAQVSAAEDAVDSLRTVLSRGQKPDYDIATDAVGQIVDPAVRTSFERRVNAIREEEDFLVEVSGGSPARAAAALESARQLFAVDGFTETESDRLAALEAYVEQASEAQEEDAIQFRVERGEMAPPPAGVDEDPNNPIYSQWTIRRANEAAEVYKYDPQANILHGTTLPYVQSYGSTFGTSKIVVARSDSARARLEKVVDNAGDYMISIANGVTSDPESLQDAFDEQEEYVSTIHDTVKSEATRDTLLKAGRGAAVFTHLTAQVKEGRFDEAESALDSGDYNDPLTPTASRPTLSPCKMLSTSRKNTFPRYTTLSSPKPPATRC